MSEGAAPVLLVSVSARALACSAARGGIRVVAADLFADLDTRAAAQATAVIASGQSCFDDDSLAAAVSALDPRARAPLVYGSGFDCAPAQLQRLGAQRRLLGNPATVIDAVKQPLRLATLLAGLGIPHPQVSLAAPVDSSGWMVKRTGGAGGGHVRAASRDDKAGDGVYFQRRVEGTAASATVLCDGREARILGYSRQLCEDGVAGRPFLYGGAHTLPAGSLSPALRRRLQEAAAALARETGLTGLWSMDLMLDEQGWWLLEINPRPGATFELHERGRSLFSLHVDACEGRLPAAPITPAAPRGLRILYAREPLKVPALDDWPVWVSDRPAPGTRIGVGEPVCSVHAEADDEAALLRLLETRRARFGERLPGWREAAA